MIWVSLVILLHEDWNVNETFFPPSMLEIPILEMPLMMFQWRLRSRLSCFWDCNCFLYLSSTTSNAWGVFWLVDCGFLLDNWLWVIFLKRDDDQLCIVCVMLRIHVYFMSLYLETKIQYKCRCSIGFLKNTSAKKDITNRTENCSVLLLYPVWIQKCRCLSECID